MSYFGDKIRSIYTAPPLPFRHMFEIPAMAANTCLDYDAENTLRHFRKYSPYSFIFVRNLAATEIDILMNYNKNIGITAISKGESTSKAIPFNSFQIYNNTAVAINANEVTIWIERI